MGVSSQRHAPGRALPPGKGFSVPIVQETGWAPEPVWTQRLEEKSFASAGDRTWIQSAVRHYTDRATATCLPFLSTFVSVVSTHFYYCIFYLLIRKL
jgi:hypothetical protein